MQCTNHNPRDGKRCEQPAQHKGCCDHSHNGKTAVRWWPARPEPAPVIEALPAFFNDPGFRKTPKGGWTA